MIPPAHRCTCWVCVGGDQPPFSPGFGAFLPWVRGQNLDRAGTCPRTDPLEYLMVRGHSSDQKQAACGDTPVDQNGTSERRRIRVKSLSDPRQIPVGSETNIFLKVSESTWACRNRFNSLIPSMIPPAHRCTCGVRAQWGQTPPFDPPWRWGPMADTFFGVHI